MAKKSFLAAFWGIIKQTKNSMRTILLVSLALVIANCLFAQEGENAVKFDRANFEAYLEFYGNEEADSLPPILVLPEQEGITEWHRDLARSLSKVGHFVMIVKPGSNSPYMRSIAKKEDGQTYDTEFVNNLFRLINWALPNKNVVLIGFGEGVQQSFHLMTHYTNIDKAFVVGGYPRATKASEFSMIQCKIFGYFAEEDAEGSRYLSFMRKYLYGNGKNFEVNMYSDVMELEQNGKGEINSNFRKEILHSIIKKLSQSQ